MPKEIIIAIFVGILLGLVVTYGVYTANNALVNKNAGAQPQTTTIPTPTPSPPAPIDLSILNPEDGIVVDSPDLTIEGSTIANAIVSIITEDDEFMKEASADGSFAQPVTLIKGANTIHVTASDANQMSATKILNIVYSTEISTEDE